MEAKKACVVYVTKLAAVAQKLEAMLQEQGFEVCLTEASESEAKAAQAGDDIESIHDCLEDAEVSYFLISDEVPESMVSGAGTVLGGNSRVVVVTDGAALPEALDDGADSSVNINSPALADVVKGSDIWQKPDGSEAPPRVPHRQKCQ